MAIVGGNFSQGTPRLAVLCVKSQMSCTQCLILVATDTEYSNYVITKLPLHTFLPAELSALLLLTLSPPQSLPPD